MKKLFKGILLVGWLCIIFIFSNQKGGDSSAMSNGVFTFLNELFPALESYMDVVTFMIRKCAHIGEYFVLSLLLFSFLKEFSLEQKQFFFLSFMFCFLFACFDEIHQLFIISRNGTILDTFVDMIGYFLATCFEFAISKGFCYNKQH